MKRLRAIQIVFAVIFGIGLSGQVIAQPTGEFITISPAGSGSATWDPAALAWLVVLDPKLDVGEQESITTTGNHAAGQPNPGITDLRIAANANGTQILLTVTKIHHIDRLLKFSPLSPDTVVVSATLDSFLGQPGSGPAVDLDAIQFFFVTGGVQNEIICSRDVTFFEAGSNLYGDVTIGGNLKKLVVGRRIAANSSGDLATFDIGGSIDYLEAGELHANITVGTNGGSGAGRVSTIKATTGGGTNFGNFSGDFNGSLDAVDLRELGPTTNRGFIQILGDLNADLTFEQDINDDNNGDPVIDVNGALTSQIVINASDGGYDWIGPARINMVDIDPNPPGSEDQAPYYNTSSSTLGGGAIGLVPFNLHGADSSPAAGAVVLNTDFLTQVRIRHYGPITIDQSVLAVKIERRTSYYPGTSNAPWVDISSSWVADDISVSSRDIVIPGGENMNRFDCGYEYRITPIAGRVSCDIASPVDVTA